MESSENKFPWWKSGVVYQIYPLSFMDSNNDGIGDIKGIISKLDYLNNGSPDSLGIDVLWISPLYKSPMKDFGYDISDYRETDPVFGSMEDFRLLVSEVHKRNIKIIMDLVLNHTSDEHPWFIESGKNRDNPKRDWYIWHKNTGKRPNNWMSLIDITSGWWLDKNTDEYYLATWTRHQPELNWRNKEVRKEIYDMMRFWLDLGVDGFRLDVINCLIKDDQYRNNPYKLTFKYPNLDILKHIYDRNRPEVHEICRELRAVTDEYKDRMLVGEASVNDVKEAVSYHGKNSDELHLSFNINFINVKWSAESFYKRISTYYSLLPKDDWPTFFLSNHDIPRHYFRFKDGRNTEARARIAAALLLTLKGTPFLYYGEEIGMNCENIPRKQLQDPLGKRGWPFINGRDAERTPMQWDSSQYSGFSKITPWLPVNCDYKIKNAAALSNAKASILSFYKELIWLRKKSRALSIGEIQFLKDIPMGILAYKRYAENEEVFVFLNFLNKQLSFNIDTAANIGTDKQLHMLSATHRKKGEIIVLNRLEMEPYEVILAGTSYF